MVKPSPDKIRLFALEYVKHFKPVEAARSVGYTGVSANRRAWEMMQLPEVQAAIVLAIEERKERTELQADSVLEELRKIVFFDPRKMLRADGSPMPLQEMDDETAKAIAGMDIAEIWEGTGEERRFVGYTKKYRLASKLDAIDKAMRHLALFNDKLEIINGNLAEKLRKARDRTRAKQPTD